MESNYKLLLVILFMYLVWIPLSCISIFVEYRQEIKKVRGNLKSVGQITHKVNRKRNEERKAIKKRYRDYYALSLIPAINVVMFFSMFDNKK